MAFLFLTRGKMPLEPAWREFFGAAALIEPIDVSRIWAPDVVLPRDVKATLAAIDKRDAAARDQAGSLSVDARTVGKAVLGATKHAAQDAVRTASRQKADVMKDSSSGRRRVLARASWLTGWGSSEPDPVAAQDLFSVYVHPPPGYRFSARNLFSGHEVGDRVKVGWAQHTVVRSTLPYFPPADAGVQTLLHMHAGF